MTRPISKNQFAAMWVEEFSDTGHCCICGNRGVIDTRGKLTTPAGQPCGDIVWCICPNGRVMKRKTGLRKPKI